MYLLASDTLNGAEGKITITRAGRILEVCGMRNIKTVAGIQNTDMRTIGTRKIQAKANGVKQTGSGNVYFGSNGSNLFTDMVLYYINRQRGRADYGLLWLCADGRHPAFDLGR